MTWMVQKSDTENVEKDLDVDAGSYFPFQVQPLSRELYDILVNTTKGDALRVVRGTDGRDGFLAWEKLNKRYNPKSMVRGLRLWMQVLSPKQVQDFSGLEGKLAEWEEKMKAMERDYPT